MTKDEAQHLIDCVEELLRLIPKSKKFEALGAANELFLHLERVKREAAPREPLFQNFEDWFDNWDVTKDKEVRRLCKISWNVARKGYIGPAAPNWCQMCDAPVPIISAEKCDVANCPHPAPASGTEGQ